MRDTIFCVSCDSRADADECTTICNSCLDLSFRAKAQWISLKDRFPPSNKKVLVSRGGEIKLLTLKFIWESDNESYGYGIPEKEIKEKNYYWMELPEPPTC